MVGVVIGRLSRGGNFRPVRDYRTDSLFLAKHLKDNSVHYDTVRRTWWRDNPASTLPPRTSDRSYDAEPQPTREQSSSSTTVYTTSPYPRKFSSDTLLDLNTVDTLTLQRVPGIGSGFSRMIVNRREKLGGYVDTRQLLELNHFPADALRWFVVGDSAVRRLNVNTASFSDLLRHPYLDYDQVRAIFRYRERVGYIHSLQDLSNDTSFTVDDLMRLQPYVDCSLSNR